MAYQYLFPPTTQFQARTGANLTAGYLRVYYTQTDDRAPTYRDFFGTENQDDIVLDNDGRAVVIVDDTKTYRLEVYRNNGACLFTIDPLSAVGGGGGSGLGTITRIISTDGTVKIASTTSGGTTYYDLSIDFEDEPSKWGALNCLRSVIDGDGSWEELPMVSNVGSESYNNGWFADTPLGYDLEASIEMQAGSGTATSMLDARFDVEVDGVVVKSQFGSLDPSRPMDRVTFGWKGEVADNQRVNGRLFVRTDQAMSLGLLGHVLYNAETNGVVGDDSGTTYAAGQYVSIDSANVISVTGVQPLSGMSAYQSAGDYAYNSALSSVSSDVTALSSLVSAISGQTGDFVEKSSISAESSIWNSASSIPGITGDTAAISAAVSGITGLTGTYVEVSAISAQSSVWDSASAVSAKVDQSSFDACCSSMSGYISSMSGDISAISGAVSGLTGQYVEQSSISAQSSVWNSASAISSITADVTSLSSDVSAISGAVSGLTGQYVEISAISGQSSVWNSASAISSKLDVSAFSSVSGTFLTAVPAGYATESYVDSAVSGKLDASASSQFITSLPADLATTADVASAVSGKLDQSASGEFYPMTGNPSGFLTAHQSLAGYATEQYVDSSVSGKLDSTAYDSAQFYLTSNPSGFITGVDLSDYATTSYVDSAVSSKQDITGMSAYVPFSAVECTTASAVTSIGGSAIKGHEYSGLYPVVVDNTADTIAIEQTGLSVDDTMTAYASAGEIVIGVKPGLYAYESSNSAKLDTSASSEFYLTSNPSGFITGVDLSPYQTTAGMTAYQPSGDYIYASSLGTGVI